MIEVDGSTLEGGGQILRTSISLSAVIGVPVLVKNIRARRDNPGLQAQHMAAIEAVARLVEAEVKGLYKGSSAIEFHPRKIRGGSFKIDVGTAGSVSLILQALAPVACFAPSEVQLELTGGTDVQWSPIFDYLELVFLPIIQRMGARISTQLIRRGHYPKGGGIVKARIDPIQAKLESINLDEFGEVKVINGVSHAVKLPRHVADRQAEAARNTLAGAGYKNINIAVWYKEGEICHLGPGSGIALCASTTSNALIGADSLGERGKPAEEVGSEAAHKLVEYLVSKYVVDPNLSDMLIPYMAVANGKSTILTSDLSLHTKTNMAITSQILKTEFAVSDAANGKIISCDGIRLEGIGMKSGQGV